MQPGRTHRHPRCEEGNLGCMTSQLLIGAKRWEPSGSSLGHCGNNALWIITRAARYHITYTKKGGGLDPLERSLACMVPEARLELARCCQRWILSPLRLPISPPGHCLTIISKDRMPCKDFFKKATRNSINKKMHPKQMHQMILLKFNIYLLIFSSFEISYSFINS